MREDTTMIKKDYIKPTTQVVELMHRLQILSGSLRSVQSTGLDDEYVLEYDNKGGDQSDAW